MKVLGGLAAIPGFSGLASATHAAGPVPLSAVRDLLLPALYARRGAEEIELGITIDFDTDGLVVKGYNPHTKNELGFAITRAQIQDNVYKAQFNSSVVKLIDELKYGPIPQGAVL